MATIATTSVPRLVAIPSLKRKKLWAGGNSEVEVKPQSDGSLPVSVNTNKTFTKCLELKTILQLEVVLL